MLIKNVLRSLLCEGNPARTGLSTCPPWPPDLFAVTATLAEATDFFTEPTYSSPWHTEDYLFSDNYRTDVVSLGRQWAEEGEPPDAVCRLWRQLLSHGHIPLDAARPDSHGWKIAAIKLLAIADEASTGIGFTEYGNSLIAAITLESHIALLSNKVPGLPFVPFSLCAEVSPTSACVQPKTNTPSVGYNLRSLTHHLSLLPRVTQTPTTWKFGLAAEDASNTLNLLLVPFPYRIDGQDFCAAGECDLDSHRYFALSCGWMKQDHKDLTADDLRGFIVDLISQSKKDGRAIHGVVFPECALPRAIATELAKLLAQSVPGVEMLIAGTLDNSYNGPRNYASVYRLGDGAPLQEFHQSKHHRWRLDDEQVSRYGLEDILPSSHYWWEKIEVSGRSCNFQVLRRGASFAVLVCEDLARTDPVMPVLNAVGPNLVVALLLDGPQLERRWSGRYAAKLASNPGSSVLTVTSLGMVRRSFHPDYPRRQVIGLWASAMQGGLQELELDEGAHAIVISLDVTYRSQYTLDGRTDNEGACAFRRSGHFQVKLDAPPVWAEGS